MKELSIFVDEAGVFGQYKVRDPYYILSFVFHNQEDDISSDLKLFEDNIIKLGFNIKSLHAGPIIRREEEYKEVDREDRKRIFKVMMSFFRKSPLLCKSIYIEKKHMEDDVEIVDRLATELKRFLQDHLEFFQSFDVVKVYYDNGHVPIAKMLVVVFKFMLSNVEFRKVVPSEYRLFQISDMLCTLQLIELKMKSKAMSRSELAFFNYSDRILKKEYLKHVADKTLK